MAGKAKFLDFYYSKGRDGWGYYRNHEPATPLGEGKWRYEPDLGHDDLCGGMQRLIVRSPGGSLCGYVGVDESHPLYGTSYDDVGGVEVHGGLTFSGHRTQDFIESHVEKVHGGLWWFGFDCAHSGDYMPSVRFVGSQQGDYRDWEYVNLNVESLYMFLYGVDEEGTALAELDNEGGSGQACEIVGNRRDGLGKSAVDAEEIVNSSELLAIVTEIKTQLQKLETSVVDGFDHIDEWLADGIENNLAIRNRLTELEKNNRK